MFQTALRLFCIVAVFLAASAVGRAQCSVDRQTGCPGVKAPSCTGKPIAGQVLSVKFDSSCTGIPVILVGSVLSERLSLATPPMCVRNCRTACLPFTVLTGNALNFRLPNLVGVQFCVQGGCADLREGCLLISPQMNITIERG